MSSKNKYFVSVFIIYSEYSEIFASDIIIKYCSWQIALNFIKFVLLKLFISLITFLQNEKIIFLKNQDKFYMFN